LKKAELVVAVAASRRFYQVVLAPLVGSPSCARSTELSGLARVSSAAVSARSDQIAERKLTLCTGQKPRRFSMVSML
jgi:hypothetical protein